MLLITYLIIINISPIYHTSTIDGGYKINMEILPEILKNRRRMSLAECKPMKIGGSFAVSVGQNNGPFPEIELCRAKISSKLLFSTRSTSFRSTKRSSLSSDRYNKQKERYEHEQLTTKPIQLSQTKESKTSIIQSFEVVRYEVEAEIQNSRLLMESLREESIKIREELANTKKEIKQELDNVLEFGLDGVKTLRQFLVSTHQDLQDRRIVFARDLSMIDQGVDILQFQEKKSRSKIDVLEEALHGNRPSTKRKN